MDIPKTQTITLSEARRFCIGLKQLAEECGLETISYTGFGITELSFDDGSSVGGLRAFKEAGLIKGLKD